MPVTSSSGSLAARVEWFCFNTEAQGHREMDNIQMTENDIGTVIVSAAIEVHRTLGGPGLLECVYEEALCYELKDRGLEVIRQKSVSIVYKKVALKNNLRLDILVNDKVIIEVKATTQYNKVFESQVLTYMRLSKIKLGYVINFGETIIKNGIHRVINGVL